MREGSREGGTPNATIVVDFPQVLLVSNNSCLLFFRENCNNSFPIFTRSKKW